LEVCLFGVTQKCPKITATTASKPTEVTKGNGPPSLSSFLESNSGDSNDSSNNRNAGAADYDSLLENDRWQQVATTHDIDLAVLRKIASQGIPDEGSYRGIVWRVLLGYLPLKDVHKEWKETLPPQRLFYRTLVDQYLYKTIDQDDDQDLQSAVRHSTLDSGRELRGQLSKTLHRDRQLRKNYNRVERLDDSMSHMGDWSEHEQNEDDDASDDGASMVSEWTMQHPKQPTTHSPSSGTPQNSARSAAFLRSSAARRRSSSQMNATQRIYHQLPSKYQVEWKRIGITLDKSESAAALGLNQLRVPQELLDMRANELESTKNNESGTQLEVNDSSDHAIGASSGDTNDNSDTALAQDVSGDDTENDATENNPLSEATSVEAIKEIAGLRYSEEHVDQVFQQFLQDAKTLEEIRKDVVRTHPDLRFYLESQDNLGIRRYAALERILFVWAKLNKGVRYVQGMNEIAATIYYVLANDLNADFAVYAEADTYYLFHTLMSGSDMMRDVFVADLDDSKSGIQGRIANMQHLLERHDPELFHHLEDVGMDPSFYAIRWLTTLLSREFLLPDTIRLWDSMFASTHKENFLRYVCGSMVMKVRDELIKGDFSRCLRLLQSYPPTNVDDILEASRSLWIYESQVTLACHRGGITLNQALHAIQPPTGIIMAFGLKGGVAPTLSDQIHDAAVVVQEQVEQTTSGLFSRAKRFLKEKTATITGEQEISSNEEKTVNDSGNISVEEQSDSLSGKETTERLVEQSNVEPPLRLRHRIWNAWGMRTSAFNSSSEATADDADTEQQHESPVDDAKAESESSAAPFSPPKKPRAWNRGRTESYGKSADSGEMKRTPII
jgi:Rab-GTPase-TBC domain